MMGRAAARAPSVAPGGCPPRSWPIWPRGRAATCRARPLRVDKAEGRRSALIRRVDVRERGEVSLAQAASGHALHPGHRVWWRYLRQNRRAVLSRLAPSAVAASFAAGDRGELRPDPVPLSRLAAAWRQGAASGRERVLPWMEFIHFPRQARDLLGRLAEQGERYCPPLRASGP